MTLYERCMEELCKPEVIKMYRDYLSVLPASAKAQILSLMCKRGGAIDPIILRSVLTSKVVAIDLNECIVTDEVLNSLHGCKALRKLELRLRRNQGRHITSDGLIALFPNLKCLEVLDLPHCKELNDEVTKVMCEHCFRIKELRIPYSSITNDSLYLFGRSLSFLSSLNILGTNVNDEGIEFVITHPIFTNLKEVNVNKCPKVAHAADSALKEMCQNVRILSRGVTTQGSLRFTFRGIFPQAKNENETYRRG